jgi:hypothetical protein
MVYSNNLNKGDIEMKKLLILILTTCMVVAVTANAFASQLYWDSPTNGHLIKIANISDSSDETDYDANLSYIGGDYFLNRVKIGADYITGSLKDYDIDVNSLLFKLGYCVAAGEVFQFAIMGGYDSFTLQSSDYKQEVTGIVYGIDASWQFERSFLDFSFYLPLNGEYKLNGIKGSNTEAGLTQFKLKYTFLFTEHFGISAGIRVDGYVLVDKSTDDSVSEMTSGSNIGLAYRF